MLILVVWCFIRRYTFTVLYLVKHRDFTLLTKEFVPLKVKLKLSLCFN